MEHENALQALIRQHVEHTSDTVADIAARGGLPRQTVSRLLNHPDPGGMPRRQTLERLAVGLEVSASVVIDAAASAAGQHDEGDDARQVAVLVGLAKSLTPSQVDVLVATARALRRSETRPAV